MMGPFSRRSPSGFGPWALGLALGVSWVAGLVGSGRLPELRLDLGPGDGPFTMGFAPPRPEAFDPYELRDGVATHWTTHSARIALPLRVDARGLGVRLRFARHFSDRGHLEARLAGRPLARFEIGPGLLDYDATLGGGRGLPLDLDLQVEGSGDRGLGVSLDRVTFSLAPGGRVRLSGLAALRLPVTVAGVAGLLLFAGAGLRAAGLFGLAVAALGAGGLMVDPWLTYRLLRGVPEALIVLGLPVAVAWRAVASRASTLRAALPWAMGLLLGGFLFRAAALNHPAFYNPDYRVHAGVVETAARAGLDVFRSPRSALFTPRESQAAGDPLRRATSGLWLRRVGDRDVGLPYSLLPHAILALLPLEYDGRLTALRVTGSFFAALPAALCALLAARVGLSPWTAALVAAAPAGAVELSLGSVPAVLGHAADVGVVLLLAVMVPVGARRLTLLAAGLAAAQLVYVSSTLLLPTFAMALACLTALFVPGGRRAARGLLLALAAGSALALLLYYRDFVPDAWITLRAMAGPGAAALADPGRDRVLGALRAWGYGTAPLLAGAGVLLFTVAARKDPTPSRLILPAWALATLALAVLQGTFPSALGFLHLALFAAPLQALAAGLTLSAWGRRGRGAALLALLAGLCLVAHGAWLQWLAIRAERLDG